MKNNIQWGDAPTVQSFTLCDTCHEMKWCEVIQNLEMCESCWMALHLEVVVE